MKIEHFILDFNILNQIDIELIWFDWIRKSYWHEQQQKSWKKNNMKRNLMN